VTTITLAPLSTSQVKTGAGNKTARERESEKEREREREREKKAAAGRADWGQRADAEKRLDFFASFSPRVRSVR